MITTIRKNIISDIEKITKKCQAKPSEPVTVPLQLLGHIHQEPHVSAHNGAVHVPQPGKSYL